MITYFKWIAIGILIVFFLWGMYEAIVFSDKEKGGDK